jgi:hypothetical protein
LNCKVMKIMRQIWISGHYYALEKILIYMSKY